MMLSVQQNMEGSPEQLGKTFDCLMANSPYVPCKKTLKSLPLACNYLPMLFNSDRLENIKQCKTLENTKFMDFNPFREGLKLYIHPPVWI